MTMRYARFDPETTRYMLCLQLPFDKEGFVGHQPLDMRPFVSELVNTQAFTTFIMERTYPERSAGR